MAKIKPGEKYFIKQTDGYYQIAPFKTNKRERMVRVIALNKIKQRLFFFDAYCFVNMDELQTKDTTGYYAYARTREGPNPIMWVTICNKEKPDNKEFADRAVCNRVKILFLYNEKYSVLYDYKKRTLNVVFDGYSNGKDKVKL